MRVLACIDKPRGKKTKSMTIALTEQCVRSSQADGTKHSGLENVVVHIGFHKSASTFLQKNVFPKLSVNYLFFSGKNNNREILDYAESTSGFDAGVTFSPNINGAVTSNGGR